ncbi:hypothetical protein BT67DRAFT_449288 [Trichocladium antarcticum]|uniref:Smr domain-containing protein n=1 Tax=Trichocladium antarcticum TaxID=1450529 RepID=A0AAN6ULB2_9PEZI|nr:hypothetical protein BT67DRAFT_449288 [Trichocladium antarcticum]
MSAQRLPEFDGCAAQNQKTLLQEFGSVLEESLIILIASERDVVKEYSQIRDILNELAEPARAEAATGFDPSGLGCLTDPEGLRNDETTVSGNGISGDSLAEYSTTISDLSDQSESAKFSGQTDLSDGQKVLELKMIFQDRFKDHTLSFILRQSRGSLERAFDELLNRQYLQESGSLPKGVDGFFTDQSQPFRKNSKAGRVPKANAKNAKLAIEYRTVSPTIDDGELEGAKDFATPAGPSAPRRTPCLLPPAIRPPPPTRPTTATATTGFPPPGELTAAANLRAAAALRRMGPLGRQAAHVYTDRARSETRALTAEYARLAEARVNQQSTDTTLDLHGAFVLDGVRITRQRVWGWWEGLPGEARSAEAKKRGFTVVTGVGKHSVGGVSRLRQAVGAYLKNDGWRAEVLTGSFYVTGRV